MKLFLAHDHAVLFVGLYDIPVLVKDVYTGCVRNM